MRVHFIAIGGSIMHNMAIAMKKNGHDVSGSDDIIYDPAKSRLAAQGLLPEEIGWHSDRITTDLDLVILGMHAHTDNPELARARELGIDIQSFPEFLGNHGKHKTTVAICGSHGKTTTTSMVMHILRYHDRDFDYAVGAGLAGFDDMVRLSDAPLIIIEGDEYLSSPLDPRPKFLHYDPDLAVITGIAWDHINVFPTYDKYLEAFRSLIRGMKPGAKLVHNHSDMEVTSLIEGTEHECHVLPLAEVAYSRENEDFVFEGKGGDVRVRLFGEYNTRNLLAAWQVCRQLGLTDAQITEAIGSFNLPDKRMNVLFADKERRIFRDYAHAPSKVKASISAFLDLAEGKRTLAVLEIHTYSSLNKEFLPHYEGVFEGVDIPVLFYNPANLEIKRLPSMTDEYIRASFVAPGLHIVKDVDELRAQAKTWLSDSEEVLLMSSSNFGGLDWKRIAEEIS